MCTYSTLLRENLREGDWDSGRIKGRNDTNKKPKEGVLSSLHLLFTLMLLDLVIHSPFSFLYQTFSFPSLTAPNYTAKSSVFSASLLRPYFFSLTLVHFYPTVYPEALVTSPSSAREGKPEPPFFKRAGPQNSPLKLLTTIARPWTKFHVDLVQD
jgi:hypothetical protein